MCGTVWSRRVRRRARGGTSGNQLPPADLPASVPGRRRWVVEEGLQASGPIPSRVSCDDRSIVRFPGRRRELTLRYGIAAFVGLGLVTVGAAAVSCPDTTPIVVEERDARAELPEIDSMSPRVACLGAPPVPGPGCADVLSVCKSIEACNQ